MFHSTPKLIHISSKFDGNDPSRCKLQLIINWQHVRLEENMTVYRCVVCRHFAVLKSYLCSSRCHANMCLWSVCLRCNVV